MTVAHLTTSAAASAVLAFLGLTAAAEASSFGISIATAADSSFAAPGCGIGGSYSTAAGEFGFSQSTGAAGCSNSFSAPAAPGLTTATVSAASQVAAGNTGSNTTTVDLSTASLHAFASAAGPSFFSSGLAGTVNTPSQFWDTLSFTVAGASSTTITNIPFAFSADGSLTAGPNNPEMTAEAGVQVLPGAGCGGGVGCSGGAGEASWSSSWDGYNPDGSPRRSHSSSLGNFDNVSYTLLTDTLTNFEVDGILSLTGPGAVEYVGALLGVKSAGGIVDFSHTASFSFDLPSGVSFTSASGMFPTGSPPSVPEPGSLALLASGLLGLGLARRKCQIA